MDPKCRSRVYSAIQIPTFIHWQQAELMVTLKSGDRGERGKGLSMPCASVHIWGVHQQNSRPLCSEAASSQRLSKLLEGKGKAKPKQATLPSQQQPASAITAAMRQHARARISHALQDNPALDLEAPQAGEEDQETGAEAAASRWECAIYHGSGSKSAYLSKLSNAISQIKRALDFAQLGIPSTASEPNLARQHDTPAQDVSVAKAEPRQGADTVGKAQQRHDPEAHSAGQDQQLSALQSVSEDELKRLMGLLSGKAHQQQSVCLVFPSIACNFSGR